MVLPIEETAAGWKTGTATPFLNQNKVIATNPVFSPDGRWIAYQSNEAGGASMEVFVRPFPAGAGRWQVSTAGGSIPTWSRTRNELFYVSPDFHLMVASYAADASTFRADPPRRWSEQAVQPRPGQRWFDLHPDGNRFVVNATLPANARDDIDKVVLVTNLAGELRRLQREAAH